MVSLFSQAIMLLMKVLKQLFWMLSGLSKTNSASSFVAHDDKGVEKVLFTGYKKLFQKMYIMWTTQLKVELSSEKCSQIKVKSSLKNKCINA